MSNPNLLNQQKFYLLYLQRLLYPPEHDALWVGFVERRSIQMHLDELLADGRVRQLDNGRWASA